MRRAVPAALVSLVVFDYACIIGTIPVAARDLALAGSTGAHAPIPIGFPWMPSYPYPPKFWVDGHYGTARYRLAVSKNGHPTSCIIIASSSWSDLDAETCRVAMRWARFQPAIDSFGNTVEGSYEGNFGWRSPSPPTSPLK